MIIKMVTGAGKSAYRYVECGHFSFYRCENGLISLDCGEAGRFILRNNESKALKDEMWAYRAYVIGPDGKTVDTLAPSDE